MTLTTPEPPKPAAQPASLAGFVPFPSERVTAYRAEGYWAGRPLDSVLRDAAVDGPTGSRSSTPGSPYSSPSSTIWPTARPPGSPPGDRAGRSRPAAAAQLVPIRRRPVRVVARRRYPGHVPAGAPVGGVASLRGGQPGGRVVITDTAGGFDYRAMAEELARAHPTADVIIELPELCLPRTPRRPSVFRRHHVAGAAAGFGRHDRRTQTIPRTHDDYVYNFTASAGMRADG